MKEVIITSSALILCIVLIRHFFKGKISSRLQYALWILVAVRLIIPVPAQLALSLGSMDGLRVMDLAQRVEKRFGDVTDLLEQPVGFAVNMDSLFGRQVAEHILEEEMPELYTADGATSVFLAGKIGLTWLDILRGIWLGGMGIVALWMIIVNLRFRHTLRRERCEFQVPEEVTGRLHVKLSGAFAGSRVKVYTVEHLASPCLYGLPGFESIYLPENIVDGGNRLRHVLTHEMCHKRHGDSFWSLLRNVLVSIYWLHPLVWVAAILSKRDCELACDEGALLLLGDEERIDYGKTLLSIITGKGRFSDLACTATTMTGAGKSIKERIRHIAEKPRVLGATVAVVLVILTVASVLVFTKSPRFTGGTWDKGALYVMTDDKRIMLPETIAGISGFSGAEENGKDLIIYQVASDHEVGRFCTVTYEEALKLVDAGRTVVPLGSYGRNSALRQAMGISHTYIPGETVTERNGIISGPSEKAPFAFDGKAEWQEDDSNQSAKKPFAFDGQTEWTTDEQPENITESSENGVPGTDSNMDETTYIIPDEMTGSEHMEKENSANYVPDETEGSKGIAGVDSADDTTYILPEEEITQENLPEEETMQENLPEERDEHVFSPNEEAGHEYLPEEKATHEYSSEERDERMYLPNEEIEQVYLPDEQITQVAIAEDPYATDCYIYVPADYSDVKEKYLEEMEYINRELMTVTGQVIVTEINRRITKDTFKILAEHSTHYLGDNSEVLALVNALPQFEGISYQGIELRTGAEEDYTLQINYCVDSGNRVQIDHDVEFLDAAMLFATIENLDICVFHIEDEEELSVEEVFYYRAELTEQIGLETLWKDIEGEELQNWIEEVYQHVVTSLYQ